MDMKLTDTFVKRKQGNGKVQKHADGGGLFLYVTPEGKKSWRLAYRFLGKQKLLVIGPYPAIGLKEARERREAAKKLLVDNVDPSVAKRQAKAEAAKVARNTFEIVAREWHEKFSYKWRPITSKSMIDRLEKYAFPAFGQRPIGTISSPELLELLRKIEAAGVIPLAHRVMQDCGRIFRYAIATGRAERDIAADLRGALPPAVSTHYATITEPRIVGRLLHALWEYEGPKPMQCALRIAPFVFLRISELVAGQWAEVDFDKGEWRIPQDRMKMRRAPHLVPLAPQVLEILRDLHAHTGNGLYMFPTLRKGKPEHTPFISSKNLLTTLQGIAPAGHKMTFHGFRSMASTILNEQGYNRDWIERQLAHIEQNGVRASYNFAQYLPERRKMMNEWAGYLDELRKTNQKEK
jgi:integrase